MATKTAARRGGSRRSRSKPLAQRARELYELWAGLFAKHELMTCATGIAFKTLTAVISLMLLGLGVLGALGRRDVWVSQIAPNIRGRVLPDVYAGINQTVDTIFSGRPREAVESQTR